MNIKSSLSKHISKPSTSEEEMRLMRVRAWLKQGCIVCFPDDIPDEWLRQGLINWAVKEYGKRGQ